ncbi:MAG: initiation control protein YabA [Firmicutes bacterium]|nr:initiation control protein YabA [Bacillota bacterium]
MASPLKILEQVQLLEGQLAAFAEELDRLRVWVEELTEENRKLSLENAHLSDGTKTHAMEKGTVTSGEAARVLGKLYEDGYHICNVNYGGLRKGDCLFCLQSLQRSG